MNLHMGGFGQPTLMGADQAGMARERGHRQLVGDGGMIGALIRLVG